MDNRYSSPDQFSYGELDDPPVIYLRNAIIVRDPARAAAERTSEMTPEGRAWASTIFLSIFAAIAGSVLGVLFQQS